MAWACCQTLFPTLGSPSSLGLQWQTCMYNKTVRGVDMSKVVRDTTFLCTPCWLCGCSCWWRGCRVSVLTWLCPLCSLQQASWPEWPPSNWPSSCLFLEWSQCHFSECCGPSICHGLWWPTYLDASPRLWCFLQNRLPFGLSAHYGFGCCRARGWKALALMTLTVAAANSGCACRIKFRLSQILRQTIGIIQCKPSFIFLMCERKKRYHEIS